jgi:hypothetical protein
MQKTKPKRQAGRRNLKPATIPAPPIGALKAEAACAYLGGISKMTLYRLCQRGLISPSRGLRVLVFPLEELQRYLRDTSTQ